MAGSAADTTNKLFGWKEIAAFVGREVRTVQRWEQELGLPVHRVPGSQGHSVFARPGEIEAWLNAGGPCSFDARARIRPVPSPARPAGSASTNWRLRISLALGAVVVLSAVMFLYASSTHRMTPFPGSAQPVINSVTPILSQAHQTIVISGHGLGTYTSFNNLDTPYLAIRDNSRHWSAGRIIPKNQDEVTINVTRWTDSEIVVTGFAGAYGRNDWVLNSSDKIEIAVWNPQTGAGPALFHLNVSLDAGGAR